MDDFYAARSSTSPPPPWSNFAPPFSASTLRANVQANHYLGDTQLGLLSRFAQDSNAARAFSTSGESVKKQYRIEAGFEQGLGGGWKLELDGQVEFGDLKGYGGRLMISTRF